MNLNRCSSSSYQTRNWYRNWIGI